MRKRIGTYSRERKGTYPIDQVFAVMETETSSDKKFVVFDGAKVLSSLSQYKVFKEKGITCSCGLEGKYFAMERTPGPGYSKYNQWHFNLYALNAQGREVMMTKDHILASSQGGSDEIDNFQTMCEVCNTRKGDMPMDKFKVQQFENYKESSQYKNHVIEYVDKYYGLKLTEALYLDLVEMMAVHSQRLHSISSVSEIRSVEFMEKNIMCVFSSKFKTIHTILDPFKKDDHLKEVPNWGIGKSKECLDLYDSIKKEAIAEFKLKGTDAETAEYFQTCKYKNLMFAMWKNEEGKFNLILWSIIRTNLIKTKV